MTGRSSRLLNPRPARPAVPGSVTLGSAALGSALGWFVASPLLLVGPWLVLAAVRHRSSAARRDHDRRRVVADLALFVDALLQRLKTGGSLARALATTPAPEALELRLRPLRAATMAGLGIGPSLDRLSVELAAAEGTPPPLDLFVNTLRVLVDRGGPALPSLERLNDTIRSAESIESEVRTQAGQATASALVLAALPALFVVGLAVLDGRMARFYLFEPAGASCLLLSGSLAYGGWWWMGRIIRGGR